MQNTELKKTIEEAWGQEQIEGDVQAAIAAVVDLLDKGNLRVSEKVGRSWHTYEWLKKAILLFFRTQAVTFMESSPFAYYDKIPLKGRQWQEAQWQKAGFRMVPGAIIRKGAYIAPKCVLMPSFVNIGAYIGEGTLVDTWASVGSCAQIGQSCHISAGVNIGGVLEPLNAKPVIIEDHCFIGADSQIVEGVVVEEGSVIAMGVCLGQSTLIIDRHTGESFQGRVPAYSVVVPGMRPAESNGISLPCALIVKRVDEKTREKVSINELLRYGLESPVAAGVHCGAH